MKRAFLNLAVLGMLAGTFPAALAQQVTLRLDTFLPPGGFLTRPQTGVFATWGERLEKDSGGVLKLQVNPGGTLGAAGRNPGAQLKLVTDGVTDVSFVIPTTTPGRFPDDNLFGLPVADNSLEASLSFWRLQRAGLMRGYGSEDFHIVGLIVNPPNTLHTREPVNRLEDLKGRKIQSSGTQQQEVLRALGAVPVGTVTVRDTAEAMSRGVVEGTPKDWLALINFRIAEVAQHHVDYPLGQATILIAMNRARLNSLPPAAKAAVEKNSGESFVRLMGGRFDAESSSAYERIVKDPKHRIVTLPQDERKRWDAVVEKLILDWRKADAVNEKLWAAYQKTLAEVRSELKSGR